MTLSPADTLVCDTTQLAVWQSDADYNYNRELIAPEVNIFEWLNRWFGEILQSIFGSQFAEDYSKTILISIAVLLLLLIGWFIYKKNPAIFIRSRKNALPYTVGEDTIYGVDFIQRNSLCPFPPRLQGSSPTAIFADTETTQ